MLDMRVGVHLYGGHLVPTIEGAWSLLEALLASRLAKVGRTYAGYATYGLSMDVYQAMYPIQRRCILELYERENDCTRSAQCIAPCRFSHPYHLMAQVPYEEEASRPISPAHRMPPSPVSPRLGV